MNPLAGATGSAAWPVSPMPSVAGSTLNTAAANGDSNATPPSEAFSVSFLRSQSVQSRSSPAITTVTAASSSNGSSAVTAAGSRDKGKIHVTPIPPPTIPPARSKDMPASSTTTASVSGLANGTGANGSIIAATTSENNHVPSPSANGNPLPKPKGPMMRRTGGGPTAMSGRLLLGSRSTSTPSIPASPRVVSDIAPPQIPTTTQGGGGLGLTSRSVTSSSRPQTLSSIAAHPMLQSLQREWENPAPKSIPGINATDDQPSPKRQAESLQPSSLPSAKRQHISPHKPQPQVWGGLSSWNKTPHGDGNIDDGSDDDKSGSDDDKSGSEKDPDNTLAHNNSSRVVGNEDATDTDYAAAYSDTDETDTDEDILARIPSESSAASSADGAPAVVSDLLPDINDAVGIPNTQDGRPYRHFYDTRGFIKSQNGAMFPTSYQADKNHDWPWICPVRSCRKRLQTTGGLGGHFNAVHNSQCLNDNLDGTFTVVGRRQARRGEKAPAIVVSQNPGDPNEPLAVPEIPSHKISSQKMKLQVPLKAPSLRPRPPLKAPDMNDLHPIPPPRPGRLSRLEREQNLKSAKSMMEGLTRAHGLAIPAKFYKDPTLTYLLFKSRVRNLDPSLSIYSGTRQISEGIFKGMLLYMVGQVKSRSCTNCPKGRCIGFPPKLPQHVALRLGRECANCMLTTPRQPCSHALAGGVNSADASVGPEEQEDEDESTEMDLLADTPDLDDVPEGDHRPQERPSPEKRNSEAMEEDGRTGPNLRRRQTEVDYRLGPRPSRSDIAAPASQRVAVDVDMSKMVEMEDWEVAPGIIKTADGDGIFYSNTFLSNNKTVKVSKGVGFTVYILMPGELLKLESNPAIVRVCNVSSGKVKAKVDGVAEEVFLGPSGMLKVPAGKAASVMNRMYIDAVLNVTSVDQS